MPSEEQLLQIFGDVSSTASTTPVEVILKNKKGSNVNAGTGVPNAVAIGSRINTKICVKKNNSTGASGAKNGNKTSDGEECVDDRVSLDGKLCPDLKVRLGDTCTQRD